MEKVHMLHRIVIDSIGVDYFYKSERNDVNGNRRYRVYILDHDAPAVYEMIFKCYESEIAERVQNYIESRIAQCQ